MLPPIQSPTYRAVVELAKEQAKEKKVTENCHRRRRSLEVAVRGLLPPKLSPSVPADEKAELALTSEKSNLASVAKKNDPDPVAEWRKQHATTLEESEIADSKRDWPALDEATQRSIILEYRELHEEIKAKGLYSCKYYKYGIESIRYGLLFSAFFYLLYIKWYLTSAVFLGMFWVSG